jgi:hypothetical protein
VLGSPNRYLIRSNLRRVSFAISLAPAKDVPLRPSNLSSREDAEPDEIQCRSHMEGHKWRLQMKKYMSLKIILALVIFLVIVLGLYLLTGKISSMH